MTKRRVLITSIAALCVATALFFLLDGGGRFEGGGPLPDSPLGPGFEQTVDHSTIPLEIREDARDAGRLVAPVVVRGRVLQRGASGQQVVPSDGVLHVMRPGERSPSLMIPFYAGEWAWDAGTHRGSPVISVTEVMIAGRAVDLVSGPVRIPTVAGGAWDIVVAQEQVATLDVVSARDGSALQGQVWFAPGADKLRNQAEVPPGIERIETRHVDGATVFEWVPVDGVVWVTAEWHEWRQMGTLELLDHGDSATVVLDPAGTLRVSIRPDPGADVLLPIAIKVYHKYSQGDAEYDEWDLRQPSAVRNLTSISDLQAPILIGNLRPREALIAAETLGTKGQSVVLASEEVEIVVGRESHIELSLDTGRAATASVKGRIIFDAAPARPLREVNIRRLNGLGGPSDARRVAVSPCGANAFCWEPFDTTPGSHWVDARGLFLEPIVVEEGSNDITIRLGGPHSLEIAVMDRSTGSAFVPEILYWAGTTRDSISAQSHEWLAASNPVQFGSNGVAKVEFYGSRCLYWISDTRVVHRGFVEPTAGLQIIEVDLQACIRIPVSDDMRSLGLTSDWQGKIEVVDSEGHTVLPIRKAHRDGAFWLTIAVEDEPLHLRVLPPSSTSDILFEQEVTLERGELKTVNLERTSGK